MTQLVSLGTPLKSFHRLACVTMIDNSEALRLTWFQTFVLGSVDSCQNRVYANQYHMTASAGSDGNFSRSLVFEVFRGPVITCKFITGSLQIYFLGEKALFFYSSKWLPLRCINVSFAFSSGYICILNYYKKKGLKAPLFFFWVRHVYNFMLYVFKFQVFVMSGRSTRLRCEDGCFDGSRNRLSSNYHLR